METYSTMMQEHAEGAQLFTEMHRLRRVWDVLSLPPPLKRGDVALLAILARQQDCMRKGEDCRHGHQPCQLADLTVSGLAKTMQQTPAAISQRLSVLEKQGLVRRENTKADRRVARITLTKKGREITEATMEHFLLQMEKVTGILGPEKTTSLLTLMGELVKAFEEVIEGANTI